MTGRAQAVHPSPAGPCLPAGPCPPASPSPPASTAERQAARLLRWYPASWRARYGEEFAELLLADIAEQPRNWRRSADVAAHGLLAELAWMAASPVIWITLMVTAATAVRRLALAIGVVRCLSRLARAACLAAVAFLAGAMIWVVGHGGGVAGLFRPGLVDGAELLAMAIALAVAVRLTGALSRASAAAAG